MDHSAVCDEWFESFSPCSLFVDSYNSLILQQVLYFEVYAIRSLCLLFVFYGSLFVVRH